MTTTQPAHRFRKGDRVRVFESAAHTNTFVGVPDYGTVTKTLIGGDERYMVRIDGEDHDVMRRLDYDARLPDDHEDSLEALALLTDQAGDAILISRVFALAHGFGKAEVEADNVLGLDSPVELHHANGSKMELSRYGNITFSGWIDGEAWAACITKGAPLSLIESLISSILKLP